MKEMEKDLYQVNFRINIENSVVIVVSMDTTGIVPKKGNIWEEEMDFTKNNLGRCHRSNKVYHKRWEFPKEDLGLANSTKEARKFSYWKWKNKLDRNIWQHLSNLSCTFKLGAAINR
jgi:hypothetical protein